jgi:membrane-associated phospholipid phosphatase
VGDERRLRWRERWRRVGLQEYLTVPALGAAALGTALLAPPEPEANWSGPILFDAAARDELRARSRSGRATSAIASHVLLAASIVHPVVVDNLLVTWVARHAPDVAWQMLWVNAQAYTLTLSLNFATKRLSLRERPWGDQCPEAADEFACDGQSRYGSFYSGHAAVTATGAGLVCAHHTQLGLYQDPLLDTAACAAAVSMAVATGVLRVTSDRHWASDVLVGHVMGLLSGYLVPTLLYYRVFRIAPERADARAPVVALLPLATPQSLQLAAVGRF